MKTEYEIPIKMIPIGIIHTSLTQADGAPIQPVFAKNSEGVIEIYEPYRQGLKDLEGFERIWLLYWFHKARGARLRIKPYIDNIERGLFATRAPARPNSIGLSSVRLLSIEAGSIRVAELDILDGTPLLDIKPYISRFDSYHVSRNGWIDDVQNKQGIADDRFYNDDKTGD